MESGTLYMYAELVRRLMRAIQHLAIRDVDGIDDALAYLDPAQFDGHDEMAGKLSEFGDRLRSLSGSDQVLEVIDELAAYAERMIDLHIGRVQTELLSFRIADPVAEGTEDDGDGSSEPMH